MVSIDDYIEERECDYKGEHYSVRDNGAIMRHANGVRRRPIDGRWTFGSKNHHTGYMVFSDVRVHIVVATAFWGANDSTKMVVDHIDTNRCNNRPENLRWVTRLENILLNEVTRKKVEYICGSIENFLNNPQLLFGHEKEDSNFMWMRTVTKEEAANTLAHWNQLADRSKVTLPNGAQIDEWIYKSTQQRKEESLKIATQSRPIEIPSHAEAKEAQEVDPFSTGRTLAYQLGWNPISNPDFPCCPDHVGQDPIAEYFEILKKSTLFVQCKYGSSTINDCAKYGNDIYVLTELPNDIRHWGLVHISWHLDYFLHEALKTYSDENCARRDFTQAIGEEWVGEEEGIDDYC